MTFEEWWKSNIPGVLPEALKPIFSVCFSYGHIEGYHKGAAKGQADMRERAATVAEKFEPDQKTRYVNYASQEIRDLEVE